MIFSYNRAYDFDFVCPHLAVGCNILVLVVVVEAIFPANVMCYACLGVIYLCSAWVYYKYFPSWGCYMWFSCVSHKCAPQMHSSICYFRINMMMLIHHFHRALTQSAGVNDPGWSVLILMHYI